MARLIEAEKAKAALVGWETDPTDEEIEMAIDSVPTVDAVPVIRCKDCKHAYCNSFAAAAGTVLCCYWTNHGGGNQAIMQQDEFCSKGERRDNGT